MTNSNPHPNPNSESQSRTQLYFANARSRSFHLRLKEHSADVASRIADAHGVSKSVVVDLAVAQADPTWLSNLVAQVVGA